MSQHKKRTVKGTSAGAGAGKVKKIFSLPPDIDEVLAIFGRVGLGAGRSGVGSQVVNIAVRRLAGEMYGSEPGTLSKAEAWELLQKLGGRDGD